MYNCRTTRSQTVHLPNSYARKFLTSPASYLLYYVLLISRSVWRQRKCQKNRRKLKIEAKVCCFAVSQPDPSPANGFQGSLFFNIAMDYWLLLFHKFKALLIFKICLTVFFLRFLSNQTEGNIVPSILFLPFRCHETTNWPFE